MSYQDQPQFVLIKCKEERNLDSSSNEVYDQEPTGIEEDEELSRENEMEFSTVEVTSEVTNNAVTPSNEPETETRSWCEWTTQATKCLISIYKEYRDGVGTAKMRNMKKFWEFIAKKLREKGYSYTPANCENKFRVLERNYRKYVSSDGKKGRFKRYFEYFEETKDIFGTKWSPYTNPISPKYASKSNSATIQLDNSTSQTNSAPKQASSVPIFTTTSLSQASTSQSAQQMTQTRVLIALPTTQMLKHPSPAIIHPPPRAPTPPVEPGPPSSPDSSGDEKDPMKTHKATFVRVLQKIRKDNSRYKKEKAAYLRSKARYYEEKNRKMNDIIGEMRNLTQSVVRLCNALGR